MSKIMVAYFSTSGNTEKAAKAIATAAKADLYEIKPAHGYSMMDLDWTNNQSRTSVEMNDDESRPPLASSDGDFSMYDTMYIGFPIWWYTAPHIICSFLEAYDFTGKNITFFATSGGGGIESAVTDLKRDYPELQILGGKLIHGVPEEDVLATL